MRKQPQGEGLMTYLTLSLECECGRSATSVQEIGFTNDRQLILRWRCTKCKKYAYVLKPLEECWKECPAEGEIEQNCAGKAEFTCEETQLSDAEFLQAIGVKLPD
jgi:hypothetical protein